MKLGRRLAASRPRVFLKREEWDFSSCPPAESDECFIWELARHCKAIKSDVRQLRSEAPVKIFDALLQLHGMRIFSVQNRRPMAVFYLCPEFPRSSYLKVEPQIRSARIRATWGDEHEARARLLDGRWSLVPSDFGERLELARQTKEPIYRVGFEELALLRINWDMPDSEIKRHFTAWLDANRPPDVEQRPDRGRGLPQRVRQTQLKKLGAWRLLQKMDWKAAAGLTQQQTGRSLYAEASEWQAAAKEVKEWLQHQDEFHTAG